MIIERAIVSTDDNPLYYEFWPLVAKGWRNTGIEPTAVVIGDLNLNYSFGTIIRMPLISGIPSGFIAQVIRFIVPCFFPEEVSVIGDIDMIPLNRDYFTKKIVSYDNECVLVFSADAYQTDLRYPMCYIAAKGKYFQEIIGLKDLELPTIETFIRDLFSLNLNWDTDELFFAKQLHKSKMIKNTIFLTRGGWKPFAKNRIDRVEWRYYKLGFCFNKYIDAHSLRPLNENIDKLQDIIEFIDKRSDGFRYFYHLLKKPAKAVSEYWGLMWQNFFQNGLYDISETFLVENSKRKIIAFSLYGNNPRYTENLETAIQSYQKLFPDWKCRVYAANDVESHYIRLLLSVGCEVIVMRKAGIDARYANWRFLAIEDKDADAVIIRDLDSFAINREKGMIDQWLASEKKLHIIRDHVNHEARIMAGMWGIKKNNISIKRESRKILLKNYYGIDQIFLEQVIYPLVRHDVLVHDSFPRFPDERPVVIPLTQGEDFIGEINTDDQLRERDRRHVHFYHKKSFVIQ